MHASITTLIFDLGNVLLLFDKSRIYKNLVDRFPACPPEWTWPDGMYDVTSSYEEGRMTTVEFHRQFLALLGFSAEHLPLEDFALCWSDIFTRNETLIPSLPDLARSYKLGMISNTNEMHVSFIREHFPEVFVPFEVCIFSHEVHLRKPLKGIYMKALEHLKARPEECYYVDDIAAYVDAAKTIGMMGTLFETTGMLISDFEREGIHMKR